MFTTSHSRHTVTGIAAFIPMLSSTAMMFVVVVVVLDGGGGGFIGG